MYGSQATSKDLNLTFPVASFKQGREESDLNQQQQMSSGLLRYRSAPSSLLGEVCEDFLPHSSSSPEAEAMFARFVSPDLRDQIGEKRSVAGVSAAGQRNPQFMLAMEHKASEVVHQQNGGFPCSASQMMYHSQQQQQQQQQLPNHSSAGAMVVESPYRMVSSMAMEDEQVKSSGNCSNLIRHSSSPAGLFSHLSVENGYAVMRDMGGFRPGASSNGEASAAAGSRLKGQMSFSSRQPSSAGLMSQISEIGSENIGGSSPENNSLGNDNGSTRCYIPSFPVASWDDSSLLSDSFSSLKRARDVDGKIITSLNSLETQNGDLRNHASSLSHQFSLPKTSSEMAAMEKYLQFQDSVPCKIRAKRGCATHPRSIAERVRRTRISERMRKLQELVPNMDKQTNTADMLDLAVEYIKDLQKQVKGLSDSRVNCTCSNKQKPNPSAAV